MADDLITDVINEAKIRKELNSVLTQLYSMRDTIIQINELGKGIGFDSKGFESARRAKDAIDKLAQAEEKLIFAQSDLAKKIAEVNAQTELQNKKNKEGARDALALSDAYGKLSKQYNEAAREAKNLAVTQGIESKAAVEAARRANELGNQLKAIDASVGQYGRNVGNYSQATFALSQILREAPAFAFSFQTGLLALSNNLPILFDQFTNLTKAIDANTKKQLGAVGALKILATSLLSPINILTALVGIFTIFGPKIVEFVGSLFNATRALTVMEKAQADLNEEVGKAVKATQGEIVEAKRLFDAAKTLTNSMEGRKLAVKELRELYPAYLKDFTDEQILAGHATAAYDKLVTSLLEVAKTKAIVARITKNASEDFDLEEERTKVQIKLDAQRAANIKFLGKEAVEAADRVGNNLDGELKLKEQLAVIDEKRAFIASQNDVLQRKAAADVTGLLDKEAKGKKKAADDAAKAAAKAAADALKLAEDNERARLEGLKIRFEKEAALQKQIVDDEKSSYDERANALDLFTLNKDSAARIQKDIDNVGVKSVQARNKTKEALDKAYVDNDIEFHNELLALQKDYVDDETKAIVDGYKKTNQKLIAGKLDEESRLIDNYKNGLISTEQYQAAKLQIENKYAILSLQLEAESTKKILELRKSRGEDVGDQEARLLEITNEIRALDVKYNEAAEKAKRDEQDKTAKNADKNAKAAKKTQEEIKASIIKVLEGVKQFSDPVFSILTNGLEKQKNAIQEQIDTIQEKAKIEIDAINNSTLSEEEKAARISTIQNVAAAKEKQLEREKRRVQQEQARFERAKAIFDIIANTAVNVVKVFPVVPLMVLAAAIGAVQLAAVASRPIPKYAKGRKGGAAELAYTGDGGVSEIIEHKGRMWVTPNRPTLTYLPEGANVYKDHQTFVNEKGQMHRVSLPPVVPHKNHGMSVDNTGAILRGNKAVVNAIKNNRPIFIDRGQSAFKIAERVTEIKKNFYE